MTNEPPKSNLDPTEEKDMKKYEDSSYDSLIKQIDTEYQLGYQHQVNKITRGLSRLKLYNNQKRDPNSVGDPMLFTVLQTILASMYDDRLGVEFRGREEGDEETAENLTSMALFDYDIMGKAELDYYWFWDTLFNGRGLVQLEEFNRDEMFMCPIPELVDPMTFLRDPRAISVHGDAKGRGAMRFGGRELWIPKREMTADKGYVDTNNLRSDAEVKSLIEQATQARNDAAGLESMKYKSDKSLGDNQAIYALEWVTWWKGKRVKVVLANGRRKIIKYTELKRRWSYIDRPLYPTAHDWDGTSIPDIVEDKQRQRSVAINLTLQGMKSDLYPMYVYDEKSIKNKNDLLEFQFNKFVASKGDKDVRTVVQPINKATPRMDLVNFVLNTLDSSAQRATATPEMQQGQINDDKRTLGELNLVASKVDVRYSLTAKIFGWSEKAFWQQYYDLYKEHFKSGIDEKMIRIVGAMGTRWRGLTRENFVLAKDPDIYIESKAVAENKRLKERVLLAGYGNMIATDPNANKREFMKKLGRLNGLTKDEVNLIYPPTIDELMAEDENNSLNEDKLATVRPNDNDYVHMIVHNKAKDTKAKAAHIAGHKANMLVKKQQPELFNPDSLSLNPGANMGNQPPQQSIQALTNAAKLPPSAM